MYLAGDGLTGVVTDGPLLLAFLVSVLVGVVGFASPCVLPLVPGYLSYVAGLTGQSTAAGGTDSTAAATAGTAPTGAVATVSTVAPPRRRLGRVVGGAALFVLGFTVVFVSEGALFGQLGSLILEHQQALQRIFGTVTIVLGLVFLGAFGRLQREVKFHRLPRAGLLGAPLLGATFGFAWTPCLTPTFTAVVTLSVSQATAGRGALLAFAYCLGLGVPFLLIALGIGWVGGAVTFLRRHAGIVSRVGGGLLVLLGVLLVTGAWDSWMGALRSAVGSTGISI